MRTPCDGTCYAPLINEAWEQNNCYSEDGPDGSGVMTEVTTLCHPEQVFAQYGERCWSLGEHSPELKLRAAEYYRTHSENFSKVTTGSKRLKFAPVTATATVMSVEDMADDCVDDMTYDYDKWEGDAGLVCFPAGDTLSYVSEAVAAVAVATYVAAGA